MSKKLVIGTVAVVVLLAAGSGLFWWQLFRGASIFPETSRDDSLSPPTSSQQIIEQAPSPLPTPPPVTETEAEEVENQELSSTEQVLAAKTSTFNYAVGPRVIQEAIFVATWSEEGVINMSLVAPDGTTISEDNVSTALPGGTIQNPERTNPDVYHEKGSRYEIYRIANPQVGQWEVRLFGAWIPSGVTSVTFQMSQIPEELEPQVSMQYPRSHVLGETFEFLATFSHPGRDRKPHTAVITWGDGAKEQGIVKESGSIGSISATHIYARDGKFPISVCVTDVKGREGCDTAELTVGLPPPVVARIADQKIQLGQPFEIETTYTTTGSEGKHKASVHWIVGENDETIEGEAILIEGNGGGTIQTQHTFDEPSPYGFYLGIICVTYPGALIDYGAGCSEHILLTYEGGLEF